MELGKNLCESLLKDGLISQETAAHHKQFEHIVNELLQCFPDHEKSSPQGIHNLKKKLGKMLSMKAREMKISDELLKRTKTLIYLEVNKKLHTQAPKRKLKFGVKREVYSSDQSEAQNPNYSEDTGQAQLQLSKKQRIMKKRKYKTFDQDFKQEVCETANKDGIQFAIQKYGLSTRKVSSWLEAQSLNLLGKGRKALDPAMQFNMSVWILNKIWNQVPLTQKVIRQKAATMKTINIKFNGSKGWLQKFFLRHVQLKSCFDTRSKLELKDQCAKYHRSAFARVLKDYENLVKMGVDEGSLVGGDFSVLIYGTASHPHLKLEQDEFIDKERLQDAPFYDYQKLKNMPSPNFKIAKKQQEDSEDAQIQQSEQEDDQDFENSSEEDLELQSEIDRKVEQSQEQEVVALNIYEEDDSDERNCKVKVKIEESFAP